MILASTLTSSKSKIKLKIKYKKKIKNMGIRTMENTKNRKINKIKIGLFGKN